MILGDKKIGRNDPCWCGSGRKYKKCHRNREHQEPVTPSESISAFRKVQRRKVCMHPDGSAETCSGNIVRAHTVQRAMLEKIARRGHVYGFPLDLGAFYSSQGIPPPKLVGVNDASTFTGFCQKHDTELFRPIETCEVAARGEHACLLTYRAFARELFDKQGALMSAEHARGLDRGRAPEQQVGIQSFCDGSATGFGAAIRDLQRASGEFYNMLTSDDYSTMEYYVVWFADPPDIMCSGFTDPDFDFAGQRLQNLSDLETPTHSVALSLIASGERGCAFFSWLRSASRPCRELIESLIGLKTEQIPHAIVRFVSSCLSNHFLRPDWWEGLQHGDRESLCDRVPLGAHPLIEIPPDYLIDDGLRAVQWEIVGVDTNVEELA